MFFDKEKIVIEKIGACFNKIKNESKVPIADIELKIFVELVEGKGVLKYGAYRISDGSIIKILKLSDII